MGRAQAQTSHRSEHAACAGVVVVKLRSTAPSNDVLEPWESPQEMMGQARMGGAQLPASLSPEQLLSYLLYSLDFYLRFCFYCY